MLEFEMPKEQSSILKVIGIGGGGSNAVNHMYGQGIEGVNFIICNTDAQALSSSNVPNKVQLGPHLTQGLGAGANPQIGREATEESLEEIKRILEVNTKMAFITAGMGGGTGTGGAPIVAKICKDLGVLTVGIVTTPFGYEGKKRIAQANSGIEKLKENVDTLLVISNDKLRHQFGNLTMTAAFAKADNVLATAAKCITDIINSHGQMNVDFADVCTVMRNGGVAILGNAECSGENRAQNAIEQALNSPLLDDNDIRGAKWILININSALGEHEFTMDEVTIIQTHLLSQAGEDSDVILGLGYDENLEDRIGITLIATGFDQKDFSKNEEVLEKVVKKEDEKIVMVLEPEEKKKPASPLFLFEEKAEKVATKDQPSFQKSEKPEVMQSLKDEDVAASLQADKKLDLAMMPTIEGAQDVEKLDTKKDTSTNEKQFFDLSLSDDFNVSQQKDKEISPNTSDENKNTNIHSTKEVTSGGYLTKPTQLYAQEKAQPTPVNKPMEIKVVTPSVSAEEALPEMKLVEKNEKDNSDYSSNNSRSVHVEKPMLVDEATELRKKSEERIAKLRNLSFNPNATDPQNEFESVPAYLRRNLELHNSIADVESFYTNYTVKSDEKNQAEIGGKLNSFLDGKKPD